MSAKRIPLDRIAAAVDSERISSSLLDALADLGGEQATELAERLVEFADAIDAARDAVEEWEGAEDREERADARDAALDALDHLHSTTILIPDDVLAIVPNLAEIDDLLE